MKKLLLLILMAGMVFPVISQEEDKSYKMFEMVYIEPDFEHIKELGEAMAKHNKEYHNEKPYRASVWMINTGPHTGEWALVMGPLTFSDLDNRPNSKEHNEDWIFNVLPHIEGMSEGEYWKQVDELSYIPEGSFPGKEVFTIYDIKPFQKYRFKELAKKVLEVYKKRGSDIYFEFYENPFETNPERDFAISFGFKKWAYFDQDHNFKKEYEEIHGEGSWQKAMEEYRDIVLGSVDEMSQYIPDLSGGTDED